MMSPYRGVGDGVIPYAPSLVTRSSATSTQTPSGGNTGNTQIYIYIGIIVGCVVIAGAVGVAVYLMCRRRRQKRKADASDETLANPHTHPEHRQMEQASERSSFVRPRTLGSSSTQASWDTLRSTDDLSAPFPQRPASVKSHPKPYSHLSAILESPKPSMIGSPPLNQGAEHVFAGNMGFSNSQSIGRAQTANHHPSDDAFLAPSQSQTHGTFPSKPASHRRINSSNWNFATLYEESVRDAQGISPDGLPALHEDVVFNHNRSANFSLPTSAPSEQSTTYSLDDPSGLAPTFVPNTSQALQGRDKFRQTGYFAYVPPQEQAANFSLSKPRAISRFREGDVTNSFSEATEDSITPGSEWATASSYSTRSLQSFRRPGTRQPSTNFDKYRSFSRRHASRPSTDSFASRPCSMMTTASNDTMMSIPQIAVADRVCISRVIPGQGPSGPGGVHQVTTTGNIGPRPTFVSFDGSPVERRKPHNPTDDLLRMEELRPRTATSSRRSSVSSEDSTWSNDASNDAPSLGTARSFRSARSTSSHTRTHSGRKIYRRRNGPRPLNAAPRAPNGPRPTSSVFMDEILEEVEIDDAASPRRRPAHRHMKSNSHGRRMSRNSSTSSFARNLQMRLLRASSHSTSPTMTAWAMFQRHGFITPISETPPVIQARSENRLSKQSTWSHVTIPEFPTPTRSDSTPNLDHHPLPNFNLSLPPPPKERMRSLEPMPLSINKGAAALPNLQASSTSTVIPAESQDSRAAWLGNSTMSHARDRKPSDPDMWTPAGQTDISPGSAPFSPENFMRIPPGTPDSWTALIRHTTGAANETPTRPGANRKFECSPVLEMHDAETFDRPASPTGRRPRVEARKQHSTLNQQKKETVERFYPAQPFSLQAPAHPAREGQPPSAALPETLQPNPSKNNDPSSSEEHPEQSAPARKPSKRKSLLHHAMSLRRKTSSSSKQPSNNPSRFLSRFATDSTPQPTSNPTEISPVAPNDFDFGFNDAAPAPSLPAIPSISKIPLPATSPRLPRQRPPPPQGSDSSGFGSAGGASIEQPSPLSLSTDRPTPRAASGRHTTTAAAADGQAWWAPPAQAPTATPLSQALTAPLRTGNMHHHPPTPTSLSPPSVRRYYSHSQPMHDDPSLPLSPPISNSAAAYLPSPPRSSNANTPKSRLPVRKSSRDVTQMLGLNLYDAEGFLAA